MSENQNNPGNILKSFQALAGGLANNPLPGLTQLAAGGQVMPVADLLAEVQGYAQLYKAAEDAAKAHDKAIQAREAAAPAAIDRLQQIRAALKSAIGKRNPDLLAFGITPDQEPAPLTVEQKLARAAKAKATRAARHTMGPKQKAAIKGQVPPPDPQGP